MFIFLFITFIVICLYFAPGLIAANRHHPNADMIAMANLLVGWTGLGWIVVMIWAVSTPIPRISHD